MHYISAKYTELKVTEMLPTLPPFLVFFAMSHSSLHNNKHFVYADYCVIKKDILLAVASGWKLQGRTTD